MREIAIRAIHMRDFTGGAVFYHSSKVFPLWRKEVKFVGQWGNHLFYRR
jgi:spore germination cell wall hydrolase CwlJ-like protein